MIVILLAICTGAVTITGDGNQITTVAVGEFNALLRSQPPVPA